MKQLCIIPCGKKKIWDVEPNQGAITADQAYIGTLHQKSKAYSLMFCDDYRILSAKHGFLAPDNIIAENYDVSFSVPSRERIRYSQLAKQAEDQKLFHFDKIIALTGKKYEPYLEKTFEDGPEIVYPLHGYKGIGYILQALQQAVDEKDPL